MVGGFCSIEAPIGHTHLPHTLRLSAEDFHACFQAAHGSHLPTLQLQMALTRGREAVQVHAILSGLRNCKRSQPLEDSSADFIEACIDWMLELEAFGQILPDCWRSSANLQPALHQAFLQAPSFQIMMRMMPDVPCACWIFHEPMPTMCCQFYRITCPAGKAYVFQLALSSRMPSGNSDVIELS